MHVAHSSNTLAAPIAAALLLVRLLMPVLLLSWKADEDDACDGAEAEVRDAADCCSCC